MAVEGGARGDFQAHEGSYARFITMFKVGTVASAIVAAVVVLLIAS